MHLWVHPCFHAVFCHIISLALAGHAPSSGFCLASWTALDVRSMAPLQMPWLRVWRKGCQTSSRLLPRGMPTHSCTRLCDALHTASCLLSSCRQTLCHALQSFEALNARAVAVVVDPIQSVKGKVVIDAFRWAPGICVLPAAHILAHSACGRCVLSRQVVFDALRWAQSCPACTFNLCWAQNPLF